MNHSSSLFVKYYAPESTANVGCPILLIHGLFGSGENWAPIARALAKTRPVFTIDLPAHDKSKYIESALDYESISSLVIDTIENDEHMSQFEEIDILGHSMGGKVAMMMAIRGYGRLRRLIVADIAPKTYPAHHQHIFAALDAVDPLTIKSRIEADAIFAKYVENPAERAFLGWNLIAGEDGAYQWRFDLNRVKEAYNDILAFPLTKAPKGPCKQPVLFLRGGLSNYIQEPEDGPLLASFFENYTIKTLEQAGHWVHVDKRAEFIILVLEFLV